MTVINTMRFSDTEAGLVADTQSSGRNRKYDFSRKFNQTKTPHGFVFMGGTGASSILHELREKIPDRTDKNLREVVFEIADDATDVRREVIEQGFRATYGLTREEFLTGRTKDGNTIRPELLKDALEMFKGENGKQQDWLHNGFNVVGVGESGKIEIYAVRMGDRPLLMTKPYLSVGSGRDQSDMHLADFVKRLPRDNQHQMDAISGMEALIAATNKSTDYNQGVGGIPLIAYRRVRGNEEKVRVLGENESNLASQLVRASEARILTRGKVRDCLASLLHDGANYKEAYEEHIAENPKAIKFLLGYK